MSLTVPDEPARRAGFPTTRIELIAAARGESGPHAREALSLFCQAYWFPIYAYLRRVGHPRESAEDLTQGFFTRLLEKRFLDDFRSERGRFRSYLLSALKHYVANEHDRERAKKRGGSIDILPLETAMAEQRYRLEPQDDLTPDRLFERQWALAVLAQVEKRLADEEASAGRTERFRRLKGFLLDTDRDVGYQTLAAELSTTEGALKVAVHRLRRRFRDLLREEIAQTVDRPSEVGDELRSLLMAL